MEGPRKKFDYDDDEQNRKPDWLDRKLANADFGLIILVAVIILFFYASIVMFCPKFH